MALAAPLAPLAPTALVVPVAPVAPAVPASPRAPGDTAAPGVAPDRRSRSRSATPRRPKLGPVGHSHHRAGAPTPYQFTRRGRVLMWMLGVGTVAIIAFGLVQGAQPASPQVVGTTAVTVAPGQSLWAVAEKVNPQADPRVTVHAIADLNGIEPGSTLRSGSTLTVPVFAGGE